MATIIPFPAQRTGDWSESERARLNELAARFADQTSIEIVFGRTDSGDPWCVILDAGDEVLVHVARVKGGFVAHSSLGDVFAQTEDLRSAVERVLGPRWQEERFDVVVPFAAGNRQAQLVAAAIVVTSFVYHHRVEAAGTEEWALADIATARTGVSSAKSLQRDEAAQLAHVADAWDPTGLDPSIGPALSFGGKADPFPAGLRPELATTSNAGTMHGKAFQADEAVGISEVQPGAAGIDLHPVRLDLPDAAPPEAAAKWGGLYHDLVEGGAGDDQLVLDHGAFAVGGDGADNFAIRAPDAPAATADAPLLGVIVDFTAGQDSLTAEGGQPLNFLSSQPVANVLADPNVNLGTISLVLSGERIGIDFDGDYREDGYLLVGNGSGPELIEAVKAALLSHGLDSGGAEHLPPPQFEASHTVHGAPAMFVPPVEVI